VCEAFTRYSKSEAVKRVSEVETPTHCGDGLPVGTRFAGTKCGRPDRL